MTALNIQGPWRVVGGRLPTDWVIETTHEFPRQIAIVHGSGRSEFAEKEKALATLIATLPERIAADEIRKAEARHLRGEIRGFRLILPEQARSLHELLARLEKHLVED